MPMNAMTRTLLACLLTAAAAAFASPAPSCEGDPNAQGLAERMRSIRDQMDRIEWTGDVEQQRTLMSLHVKTMHESLRELRRRPASDACRIEIMHAMMEQMLRHQLAAQDAER
jgi:hypothetical protein